MEWVNIINDGVDDRVYQLWSPEFPTVRTNGNNTPRMCAGVVHRSGEWPQWRARVSGSEHTSEFDNKDEAMAWVEAQAKLMGFT